MSLASLLDDHRIVVCVGSGGVGKTTIAAALALAGAQRGRRAMVLTIDPARRLAQSLGLENLSARGEEIPEEVLRAASVSLSGSLSAGMLDQKSAWDEFITRHAPTPEASAAVLNNQFYQQLSSSFAGSTEYMAVEELCRIDEADLYDLIVLDTPPTAHALDFLEAPRRLEDFLDRSMIGWLVKPYFSVGWGAWKAASRSAQFLFERIERATGVETLRQISEFFIAMEGLFDGITERSRRVRALLSGASTAFVLVAGADEQVLGESEVLAARMADLGVALKGVVMNRVHPLPSGAGVTLDDAEATAWIDALESNGIGREQARWLVDNYVDACASARAEAVRGEAFAAGLPPSVTFTCVAEQGGDVHDLGRLAVVSEILCSEP